MKKLLLILCLTVLLSGCANRNNSLVDNLVAQLKANAKASVQGAGLQNNIPVDIDSSIDARKRDTISGQSGEGNMNVTVTPNNTPLYILVGVCLFFAYMSRSPVDMKKKKVDSGKTKA